jgi:L-alanine-DL-glutamate epimerase-like enolase superfamily enzyme
LLKDDITDDPIVFRDGSVFVPEGSGVGVTTSPEKIEKYGKR